VHTGHLAHLVDGGWPCQEALASGLRPGVPASAVCIQPIGDALHAGTPLQGSWRTRLHGDAVQEQGMDHGCPEAGQEDPKPLLHLQIPGQVWRAANGPLPAH
jgi:hypothetical protein